MKVVQLELSAWNALLRLTRKAVMETEQEWYESENEYHLIRHAMNRIDATLLPPPPAETLKPHERLSPRELEVMLLISQGVPPATIANRLSLSVKTVSTYRARCLEKMGMRANAELANYATLNNLIPI